LTTLVWKGHTDIELDLWWQWRSFRGKIVTISISPGFHECTKHKTGESV
jgi:hypothetical protein